MKLADFKIDRIYVTEVTGKSSIREEARAICDDVAHEALGGCDWLESRVLR